MEPPSDISASMGGDDFFLPKPYKSYDTTRKRTAAATRREIERNAERNFENECRRSHHNNKKHHRSKYGKGHVEDGYEFTHHRRRPKRAEQVVYDVEDHSDDDFLIAHRSKQHQRRLKQMNKSRIYKEDSEYNHQSRQRSKNHRSKNIEEFSDDEYQLYLSNKSNKKTRDKGDYLITKRKSYGEDLVDNIDDLEIGKVHTAYSYNSDDSAESFIEERSRGSRYNSSKGKKGNQLEQRQWGWKVTNGDDYYKEKHDSSISRLKDFEKPRYDRKNKSSHKEDNHRRRSHERGGDKRVAYNGYDGRDPGMSYSDIQKAMESSSHYRVAIDNDDIQPPPPAYTSRRDRFHKEARDPPEGYVVARDYVSGSCYASPSGKVASDYEFHGQQRTIPARKKSSKGLLGMIRGNSCGAGKTEKSSGKILSGKDNIKLDGCVHPPPQPQGRRKGDERQQNPTGLFAQTPPSMQSDVSFGHKQSSDYLQKELDFPSTLPRKEYLYSYGRSSLRQKEEPTKGHPIPHQKQSGCYYIHELPLDPSGENLPPHHPFESFRTQTPALRSNPDFRHYTTNGYHQSQQITLPTPKLVRQHPHPPTHVFPQSNNKRGGFIGCY
jgi:hypothetical protein